MLAYCLCNANLERHLVMKPRKNFNSRVITMMGMFQTGTIWKTTSNRCRIVTGAKNLPLSTNKKRKRRQPPFHARNHGCLLLFTLRPALPLPPQQSLPISYTSGIPRCLRLSSRAYERTWKHSVVHPECYWASHTRKVLR